MSTTLHTQLLRAAEKAGLARWSHFHPRLYRLVRRAVAVWIGGSPASREIIAGPLRGYKMVLGHHDRYAYLVNQHERMVVERVQELCRPGMRVLDVGAHVGYFTLLFSVLVGPNGQVIAVEPNPENLSKLRAMLKANSVTNTVVVSVAAAAHAGEVSFAIEHTGQMGHITKTKDFRENTPTLPVMAARLDDVVCPKTSRPIDLIKLDVEGAESAALDGMSELLSLHRPQIICEWHPTVAGMHYEEVFTRFGYVCELLEPASANSPFHILARPDGRHAQTICNHLS